MTHTFNTLFLFLGLGLAALSGILLGLPVLRLRGDYLAIVTLGFGEIIRIVLNNWDNLTEGPNGLMGMAKPTLWYPVFAGGGLGWDEPRLALGYEWKTHTGVGLYTPWWMIVKC